ncbi:MAG: hypothetical protein GW939_02775 [Candidatus Magasanikbacteria bacterium]|uniref:N-end rule aminoacyl transferase C-terminal domain-containing protein n=1 Tax=Candidatus Magasanikbacteria bacterium CG10_big_fil_rev_8_21_14_0_10_38_6 TaxID=1974647 RepID=A0A2M6P1C8_9BACT|nr:hypothetical protein [Candidatus Magasanikbacteria bacterium]PIR77220.1 MAG: hypothetical protein COU30_03655 [Candidatus Magasanikbacteria bacterium CG10_big_fil_rev_8_21_14_0_10_38_6]
MSHYLHWNQQTIQDFSEKNITAQYNDGYVFTRVGKGHMDQTRSVRIDLSQFELSSENRRILRKTEELAVHTIALPHQNYHWSIGKLAKDFYENKFGEGTFSANKIKELLTTEESNFNTLLQYIISNDPLDNDKYHEQNVGYAICYQNKNIFHYSYPFYNLSPTLYASLGMGMMIRAIQHATQAGKQYIYLGSAQRPGDTYKCQFKGLEWFNGKQWQTDLTLLKELLTT